jgi:hypothetical protein
MTSRDPTRREALALAIWPFSWLFPPRRVSCGGAVFLLLRHGRRARRYLHIHGDEETARQVLREHLKTARGTALLVEGALRNVRLAGGQLDPNRLFSREGAGRNLRRLNPEWTPPQLKSALDRLDRERPRLLRQLWPPRGGLVVALHNNARGYSVETELAISERVWLPKRGEPHEFFLVTDPRDYERLAAGAYNVVLQNRPAGEEDGSCSRLAARRGVRYVNLEVAIGRADRQREMLAWADRVLPERYAK